VVQLVALAGAAINAIESIGAAKIFKSRRISRSLSPFRSSQVHSSQSQSNCQPRMSVREPLIV
jgi:hypothetical protein